MIRLLKAETFKLFRNKTFVVLCIVALGLGIFNIGMTKLISSEDFIRKSMASMTEEEKDATIEQLKLATEDAEIVTPGKLGVSFQGKDMFNPKTKEVFHSGFGIGLIEILIVILIGGIVAKEYSTGTIKNMLAYGKRRRDYYLAKFLAASLGGAILLAIMVFSNLIISLFIFPWGEDFNFLEFLHILKTYGAGVIVVMAMVSLIMFLATLLKSNGATIGAGIGIFVLTPTIISLLYGKYDWFDKIYESTVSYNYVLATAIKASNGDIIKSMIISIITIIISLFLGIILLNKQDIK
ncbi:MAG: ABC transporter permease [Clostridiaceae bacterium]